MINLEIFKKNFKDKMPPKALEAFLDYYQKYKTFDSTLPPWKSIQTPSEDLLPYYHSIPKPTPEMITSEMHILAEATSALIEIYNFANTPSPGRIPGRFRCSSLDSSRRFPT